MKNNAFRDSKFDKIRFIINGLLASIIYFIILPKKRKKRYWLIGGHLGKIYNDNSRAFFEFLMDSDKKEDTFWILNKGSIADKENKYRKNIIYRGSIKNFLYCFRSKVIVVSHSFADVMPVFYKFSKLFKINSVYLFHGIFGFKKSDITDVDYYNRFTIVNSVSKFEKDIKINSLGIKEEKIKIMGLPRYDKLYEKRNSNGNIMVMFTWRSYLEDERNRENYLSKIKSFLTNKKLLDYLEKHEIVINVVLHSFVHQYYDFIKGIESKYIKILPKNSNIQDQLIDNSLLITDYSSVAWDFAYMKKPVIFYHFDLQDYLNDRGSYLDLKKDLFGQVAYEEDKLIEYIKDSIRNKFRFEGEASLNINKYFKYNDNNNCKRVFDEINKISWRKNGE